MNIRYEKTVPGELMSQDPDLQEQRPPAHWVFRLALAGMAVGALLVAARFIER